MKPGRVNDFQKLPVLERFFNHLVQTIVSAGTRFTPGRRAIARGSGLPVEAVDGMRPGSMTATDYTVQHATGLKPIGRIGGQIISRKVFILPQEVPNNAAD
jgi:hypothetical protein